MEELESERLVLRRWREPDVEGLRRLSETPEVMRYIGSGRTRGAVETESAHRYKLAHWEAHGFGARAAVEKATGEWVGYVELQCAPPEAIELDRDAVEIGWLFVPSVWGRGLATEGACVVRDEAFGRVGLPRVVARYQPANVASGRVMEKIGMRFERQVAGSHGEAVRVYRLDRARWLVVRSNQAIG